MASKKFGRRIAAQVIKRDSRYIVIVRREFALFGKPVKAESWKMLPGRRLSKLDAARVAAAINYTGELPLPGEGQEA